MKIEFNSKIIILSNEDKNNQIKKEGQRKMQKIIMEQIPFQLKNFLLYKYQPGIFSRYLEKKMSCLKIIKEKGSF